MCFLCFFSREYRLLLYMGWSYEISTKVRPSQALCTNDEPSALGIKHDVLSREVVITRLAGVDCVKYKCHATATLTHKSLLLLSSACVNAFAFTSSINRSIRCVMMQSMLNHYDNLVNYNLNYWIKHSLVLNLKYFCVTQIKCHVYIH